MKIEIEIHLDKSINENAGKYYDKAKKARAKAKRIEELLEKGIYIKKKSVEKKKGERKRKKWYEHFRWFYSKKGFLVVAGKNANQNERLYKNVIKDDDLFLHAEIVGAPFTIIKKGINADDETIEAAAQFAGSYSRAWKFGYAAVDVYAVKKNQLTKGASGMYVKKGAVVIIGKRRWFRNVWLELAIGLYKDKIACFPARCAELLHNRIKIVPGKKSKEDIAREIAKKINVHIDDIVALLPAGESEIKE